MRVRTRTRVGARVGARVRVRSRVRGTEQPEAQLVAAHVVTKLALPRHLKMDG